MKDLKVVHMIMNQHYYHSLIFNFKILIRWCTALCIALDIYYMFHRSTIWVTLVSSKLGERDHRHIHTAQWSSIISEGAFLSFSNWILSKPKLILIISITSIVNDVSQTDDFCSFQGFQFWKYNVPTSRIW